MGRLSLRPFHCFHCWWKIRHYGAEERSFIWIWQPNSRIWSGMVNVCIEYTTKIARCITRFVYGNSLGGKTLFGQISRSLATGKFHYRNPWIDRSFNWYFNSTATAVILLQLGHDRRDGVSNHQPHDCLLTLFRRGSKKTSKLRVTDICEGNSPVTGEIPARRTCNAQIWWRHHDHQTSKATCKIVFNTMSRGFVIFRDTLLHGI